MLKIPKSLSVLLSLAIAAVFFIICIAGLFVMPWLCRVLIDLPDNIGNRGEITLAGRTLVLAVSYGILIVFMLADGLLIRLLLKVRKGQVFTPQAVSCIRGVSWCCFLLCLLFGVLTIYFQLSALVAFLAVFLGLCLRVCKNAIEEATAIKNENDLTV